MAEKIYIFNTIPKIGFPTTKDVTAWDDWWHKYIIATGRSDRAQPTFTTNVLNHNDWDAVPAQDAFLDLFFFPDGTWLQMVIGRGKQASMRHKQDADTTLSSVVGNTSSYAYAFGFSLDFSSGGASISYVSASLYSGDTGELTKQNMAWPPTAKNILAQMYLDGEYTVVEAGEPDPFGADPYGPGGSSGTGGGTGTFDGTGDDIDIPSLPTLSAVDTGFITLFNPSAGQLVSLANYMWSNPAFDLNAWKKIFADPMDAILGLSIVPVAVPNGGVGSVTVGNISTGISMTKAASQYVSVDCGTLNVKEFWGAYLDYDPYTKAEIYLPYCGTHPLATDDIMGKSVHVVYHIDILSGACCAYVKCGGSVLYTFIGQCSSSIPITGNDWTNVINGVISAAVSVGTMVATGGASAPMAVPALASTAMNSMKPSVEKSGAMGGTGGMLAVQTPYLILTRPRQALPSNLNKFTGYPSFITQLLGDCSGYTEIESIHIENVAATEQELSEIENLLKSGVIM